MSTEGSMSIVRFTIEAEVWPAQQWSDPNIDEGWVAISPVPEVGEDPLGAHGDSPMGAYANLLRKVADNIDEDIKGVTDGSCTED